MTCSLACQYLFSTSMMSPLSFCSVVLTSQTFGANFAYVFMVEEKSEKIMFLTLSKDFIISNCSFKVCRFNYYSCKDCSCKFCFCKFCFCKVCSFKICSFKVCSCKDCFIKVCSFKICSVKVCLFKFCSLKICPS